MGQGDQGHLCSTGRQVPSPRHCVLKDQELLQLQCMDVTSDPWPGVVEFPEITSEDTQGRWRTALLLPIMDPKQKGGDIFIVLAYVSNMLH